ncbi:MAG: ParB N-terminal domain-containing protein [Methylomicrobium sp.]|nr:ParB N-terminal domain-containing protein [Methylomicrobium sp.]
MNLNLQHIDPNLLIPNDWNPNVVSDENQKKLDASLERLGSFKPVLVRELDDGTLQILGGKHRRDSAVRRKLATIPVANLGKVDDIKAKEISLADNERYGEDDATILQKMLNSLETASELPDFLPYSIDDIDSILNDDDISIDDFDIDADDDLPIEEPKPSSPTHRIMRFKVQIEDAESISDLIDKIIRKNGLNSSDSLTNAGDALVHICRELW